MLSYESADFSAACSSRCIGTILDLLPLPARPLSVGGSASRENTELTQISCQLAVPGPYEVAAGRIASLGAILRPFLRRPDLYHLKWNRRPGAPWARGGEFQGLASPELKGRATMLIFEVFRPTSQSWAAADEAEVLKTVQNFSIDWDRMKRTIPPRGLTLHTPGYRYRIRDSVDMVQPTYVRLLGATVTGDRTSAESGARRLP